MKLDLMVAYNGHCVWSLKPRYRWIFKDLDKTGQMALRFIYHVVEVG